MSKVDTNDYANTAIKAIDDKSAELRSISIKVIISIPIYFPV